MFAREIEQAELHREELDERIQRLHAELVRTEDAIRRAEAELNQLTGFIDALEKVSDLQGDPGSESGTNTQKRQRTENPSRTEVADTALSIIMRGGKPLTRAELFEALAASGIRIEGKDPSMILSTMLWRERERIVRLRGFGYWPADRAYLPANYDPVGQQSLL